MEFSTSKNKFIQTEVRKAVTKDQGQAVLMEGTLAILRGRNPEEMITDN